MAQINIGGSIGVPGNTAVLGSTTISLGINTTYTLQPADYSNKFLVISGSPSSTVTISAPITQGQEFTIQNLCGKSVIIKPVSGSGTTVTIPNGDTVTVVCDGALPNPNYLEPGGTSAFTAGGDLSGTSSSQTVVGIQNHAVSSTPPTNGQILEYVSAMAMYVPTTLGASGVSWTGDLNGSSDDVQYVTSISGEQGGSNPGRVQLYANQFYIVDYVTSNFTILQEQQVPAVVAGLDGYSIIVTAQQGQRGGVGYASGSGGNIEINAGAGASGGGSIPSNGGNVEIFSGVPGSGGSAVGGNILLETGDSAQYIEINNTAGAGSNGITINSLDNFVITNTETGAEPLLEINNIWDGYTSSIQMNGQYIYLNSEVQPGYNPYLVLKTNGYNQLQITYPPYSFLPFNSTSQSNTYNYVSYNPVVAGQTQISTAVITLATLAGNGAGLVATDTNGNLSFTNEPVTWADDLAGSTSTNQYVVSLTGSDSIVTVNASELTWADGYSPNLNQANYPSTASRNGSAGHGFEIQAQTGQNATGGTFNGGNGGELSLFSGQGGSSSGGSPGYSGQVTVGDGSVNNLQITPHTGNIFLASTAAMQLIVNANEIISLVSSSSTSYGTTFIGSMNFQTYTVTSSSYTVDSSQSDYVILVNYSSGVVTITLPTPTAGRILKIKDTGNATSNHITISHHSSETIDGASTYVLSTNYDGVELTSDGTNWFVTSDYNGSVI